MLDKASRTTLAGDQTPRKKWAHSCRGRRLSIQLVDRVARHGCILARTVPISAGSITQPNSPPRLSRAGPSRCCRLSGRLPSWRWLTPCRDHRTGAAVRRDMDQNNLQAEALRRVPALRNIQRRRRAAGSSECWLPPPQGATATSASRCGAVLGSSTCAARRT